MEITPAQTCDDLQSLLRQFKIALHQLAESLDLTPAQISVLYVLQGEASMGRVAQSLHCDASNVTGIIDRLVAQQLVERQESAHDRRTKILRLTPKGEQTMRQITTRLPEIMGCQRLNSAERSAVHQATLKLTA